MELQIQVVNHPLARDCLARLRDRSTPASEFRLLTRRLSALLVLEATRHLKTVRRKVETPLEAAQVEVLGEPLVVVPVIRAGLGMLDAVLELYPQARVGYLGLERDEETARASAYYRKLPPLEGATVLLVDPMLATGGSAAMAMEEIGHHSPRRLILVSIVAAPEGVQVLNERFPQAEIYTAALDRQLDDRKYILPGLGDFGDRLYDTT